MSKTLSPSLWRGCFNTCALVTQGHPNTPRKESKDVPEGNDGLVPRQEEFGSGQPKLANVYRMFKERFDQSDRYWCRMRIHFDQLETLDEIVEMTETDQRLASLEHDARQPRLAKEADGQAGTKTREHTEGAAKAVQAMHGDSFSANWVDPDPMCWTSFSVKVKPPALPCGDDVVVANGAAVPKSCLAPLEMRTTTAAGGLHPTGKPSTATRTTFDRSTL